MSLFLGQDMESELVQGEIEEATDEEEEGENEPSDDEAENIVRVTSRKSVDASMEDSGDEESLSLRAQMVRWWCVVTVTVWLCSCVCVHRNWNKKPNRSCWRYSRGSKC